MSRLRGLFEDTMEDIYEASDPGVAADVEHDELPEEPIALTALPRSGLAPISSAMMDEALARVIKRVGVKPEVAAAFTNLASGDTNSPFCQTYYSSKQAAVQAARSGVSRQRIKIKPLLDDAKMEQLQAYAPEYLLEFVGTSSVDHSVAHVMRKIDHRLLWARIPESTNVVDIGGNPIYYIHEGFDNVHICGRTFDSKDASRYVLRDGIAKTLTKKPDVDPGVKSLAARYMARDPKFVCGKLAQECTYKAPVLLSLHVYDIPLQDWPAIMRSRGAYVVEGCMLYSESILTQTAGTLELSDARFEVDVKADLFKMGFKDSPSVWYTHKWSDYCKYGVDQLFQVEGESKEYYSYRITERRGDTIFFRILRGKGKLPKTAIRAMRSPKVNLVKVHGFELKQDNSWITPLKRKIYYFPESLWYNMVSQAAEDFERGVLDFAAMYRYYRTVSVRQTVNAVLVVGGDPVSHDELVPLVVHSCLAAAVQSTVGQRETRGLTDFAIKDRASIREKIFKKMKKLLVNISLSPVLAAAAPLKMLCDAYVKAGASDMEQYLVAWEPIAEVVKVPVDRLLVGDLSQAVSGTLEHEYLTAQSEAQDALMLDHCRALVTNPELFARFLSVADQDPDAEQAPSEDAGRPPSEYTLPSRTTYNTESGPNIGRPLMSEEEFAARETRRKAAIVEYIDELKITMRATESSCSSSYGYMTIAGRPKASTLRNLDDHHAHPDFWNVVDGIIVSSVRGLEGSAFSHSAVYSPHLMHEHSCIRSVIREEKRSASAGGRATVVYKLDKSRFTGYVMTNDSLAIFNGNEIIRTLELALTKSHGYTVKVVQAPPGCGKTHAIKSEMRTDGSDFFACPVRESAASTLREFSEDHADFQEPWLRMRTVDSYLTNYTSERTVSLRADRLLADELYMTHAGKWYAMAALLGVKEIWGYGDLKQIPHIPRVEASSLYAKVEADVEDALWVNYRNPASALAAWGHLYDNRLRAMSNEKGGFEQVKVLPNVQIEDGTVMMCMYQATKVDLKKMYSNSLGKIKILTAHEAEGKTYDNVWLHKLDSRVRTDKSSLYDSEPHCLVAASRHRKTFKYINLGADDLISSWVLNSKDPRKLVAVKDVKTAGTSA